MDPLVWKKEVEENGFHVLFAGYCGGIDLWQSGGQTRWQRIVSKLIIQFLQI
jgi:hypothetical protein